ncbi:ankyrin repeats (3 copies) domain-containing protein [Sarocladium implicatum]|nr:ankyrin repeats (3 copies) domain-containing protein [Sarocladium implicatum]
MSDPNDYAVAWISAITTEAVAAQLFLDERHEPPSHVHRHDHNVYTLGRIGPHNIVMASLPKGEYGIASAAVVSRDLLHSFPNIRIGLMVGIGGGAPTKANDIRLGDVVVSIARSHEPAVFQYDFGKTVQDQSFQHTQLLNQPPPLMRAAAGALEMQYEADGHDLETEINDILTKKPRLRKKYCRPPPESDKLFFSSVKHFDACAEQCSNDFQNLVKRPDRDEHDSIAIHFGTIASANQLMKDATLRDKLAAEKSVLCFEMEAAGLMNHFPCLVIRGICDYSDTHKHKEWQGYAAMVAAAYTRHLLQKISPAKVEFETRLSDSLTEIQNGIDRLQTTVTGTMGEVEAHTELLNAIQQDVQQQQAFRVEQASRQDSSDDIRHMNAFDTGINYVLQKDRNSACTPDTGQWLFRDPVYEAFEKAQESQLLFVTAEAGGGKSTNMRTLIDRLQGSSQSPLVAYFFFKDDDDQLRSYDVALSTCIYQLLVQDRRLIKHTKEPYQGLGNAIRHHTNEMWQLLLSMASQSQHEIMCVLDAVDECAMPGRTQLIADLVSLFQDQAPLHAGFKVILTSRPYADNSHRYEKLIGSTNVTLLAGENARVQADIRRVIQSRAEELTRKRQLDQNIQDLLVAKLSEQNAHTRSFLAVRMAFELLDSHHRMHRGAGERTVSIILSEIPQQLGDQFDEMLRRSADPEHARRLLCVIISCRKVLKLEEFKVIYSLTQPAAQDIAPATSYDELEVLEDDGEFKTLETILHILEDLIEGAMRLLATQSPFFSYAALNWHEHFVHGGDSARRLLASARYAVILNISKPSFWAWFLPLAERINGITVSWKSPVASVWDDDMDIRRGCHQYASFLKESCLEKLFPMDNNVSVLFDDILNVSNPETSASRWPMWQASDGYELIDAFHIAVGTYGSTSLNSFNKSFHTLTSHGPLLSHNSLVNEVGVLDVPLVVASRLGNARLCLALLKAGANPNKHGVSKHSPLRTQDGSEAQSLLDLMWNPLLVALHHKAYITAALLLAYGAEPGFKVPKGKSLARKRHKNGRGGLTPLHIIATNNHVNRRYGWRRVLSSGGQQIGCAFEAATRPDYVTAEDSAQERALRATTERYERYISKRFRDDESDSEYETFRASITNDFTGSDKVPYDVPLDFNSVAQLTCDPVLRKAITEHLGPSERQEILTAHLLKHSDSVNARTETGRTPLLDCVEYGPVAVAKTLLKHGADPNIAEPGGCTPLMVAAKRGDQELVDALLIAGADPDAQLDKLDPGKTRCCIFINRLNFRHSECYAPLSALAVAAERGDLNIVKALVDHGADVNLPIVHHAHGRLYAIRDSRRQGFLRLLGQSDSASDSETDEDEDQGRWEGRISVGTALTWARGEVRDLLLSRGADPTKEEAIRECDCAEIENGDEESDTGSEGDDLSSEVALDRVASDTERVLSDHGSFSFCDSD